METVEITFEVSCTGDHLYFECWLDGESKIGHVATNNIMPMCVQLEVDNDKEQQHLLEFVLKDKKPEHTQIDEHGDIVKDSLLKIQNICIDELDLDQIVYANAVYQHHCNDDNAPLVEEQFFGSMGCNGTVKFEFDTPFYLWYLEHA